uniref:Uncharacterized protein n=1 Tax=Mycobacterium leprae TaxID=1769 RepID=O07703_MYCLR|nr:hypothetical protein MLCL282.29c [Mycobacterium leprae]
MLRLGQGGVAEISLGEHTPFGAQPTQIIIGEITSSNFTIGSLLQCGQLPTGNVATRVCIAYLLTTITASVADRRSLASTWITGMCAGRVSACRTSLAGYLGVPPNSFTAIEKGGLRCSKKSTATKRSYRRRKYTSTIAPTAPRTRPSHMNQNRR